MIDTEKLGRPWKEKPRTLAGVSIIQVGQIRSPSFLHANLTIDLL